MKEGENKRGRDRGRGGQREEDIKDERERQSAAILPVASITALAVDGERVFLHQALNKCLTALRGGGGWMYEAWGLAQVVRWQ